MSNQSPGDRPEQDNPGMTLARGCWSITAAGFLIGAVILLIEGDLGYAIVAFVIAASAAINLFQWPESSEH